MITELWVTANGVCHCCICRDRPSCWSLLYFLCITIMCDYWFLPTLGSLHEIFREETFRSESVGDPTDPVYEVCGIFSNRELLSASARQSKVTEKANFLGVPWSTMTNNSEEGFSCLACFITLGGKISVMK